MKKIFKIYFFVLLTFPITYLILFHSPIFSSQKVLFYRGIGLLLINSSLFLLLIIIFYFKISRSHIESFLAALAISISINLSFFVLFPVTFDRSLTIFILNSLNKTALSNKCNGISESNIQSKLINDFILTDNAVSKRIREQLIIGMINGDSNCISLTNEGKQFLNFSTIVNQLFGIQK